MTKQRALLRNLKASHQNELTSLKHFIRELSRRIKAHSTDSEHCKADLIKAKHDAEFYKTRIKDITARLKGLSST